MTNKRLIPCLYLESGRAVTGFGQRNLFGDGDVEALAGFYSCLLYTSFRPSVCNRLDKNTSGLVAAGKSLAGLQALSELFHDRTIHKDYLCIVKGVLKEQTHIRGYLKKDSRCNKVTVYKNKVQDAQPVETVYTPLGSNGRTTLLKVRLVTGRTHQIRAHLASRGYPLSLIHI